MKTLQTMTPHLILSSGRRPAGLLSFIAKATRASQQRKALRNLDDSALCDIGLSRLQASQEASRKFWDVPANWRR